MINAKNVSENISLEIDGVKKIVSYLNDKLHNWDKLSNEEQVTIWKMFAMTEVATIWKNTADYIINLPM